ncbi:MAG TPA: 30S ribosomal protein S6 [Gemmataceae bacterium]|jgi:small subunit ribosomal protein S6|nr:30S ribosomal protein S6 [Gemmataceae bacterium]
MPVNSYECLLLLDPTKTATDMEGVKSQLHHTLEKYGAEILASRKWDDRKLAYPIGGHKKGLYYLTYFKADSRKISELDHDFRLSEVILRHMISAIDPKWHEEMLAVAQDEHRSALQLMHEEAPEGGAAGLGGLPGDINMPEEGGDRPRRGPRRSPEAEVGKE